MPKPSYIIQPVSFPQLFFSSILAFYGLQVISLHILSYFTMLPAVFIPGSGFCCFSAVYFHINFFFAFNPVLSVQLLLFLNSSAADKPRQQQNVWLQLEHKQIWNFITSSQRDLRDNWHTALNLSTWKDISATRTSSAAGCSALSHHICSFVFQLQYFAKAWFT